MKKVLYVVVGLIIVSTITVFAIGPANILVYLVKPSHSFEEDQRAETPDYTDMANWAAHPEIDDLSDQRPEGINADPALSDIDVFYIHPTGYLKGKHWNSMMELASATEENTMWMLANQASVFSDCRVYAPRYREATIYSFADPEGENESSALGLAYEDVLRAFEYFLDNENQGRPFIIASHSQGTFHAMRLLHEKIDKSPMRDQMIAAYLIGMSTVTEEAVAKFVNIPVCTEADQTNCLIHWATFAMDAPRPEGWGKTMICVNPLTWRQDGEFAAPQLHEGYVPAAGIYNLGFYGDDDPKNGSYSPLAAPIPNHTFAVCKEGRLLVDKQENNSDVLGQGNYHGWDYHLFAMNIRNNVGLRVKKYLEKVNTQHESIVGPVE